MARSVICFGVSADWEALLIRATAGTELRLLSVFSEEAALAELSPEEVSVFFCDAMTALQDGARVLKQLGERAPTTSIVLTAGKEIEEDFEPLYLAQVSALLGRNSPPSPERLQRLLRSLRTPLLSAGLSRHVPPENRVLSQRIRTFEEKRKVIDQICANYESQPNLALSVFDARLIVEELVNNAFFHAFRTPGGLDKYSIQQFEGLSEDEEVVLSWSLGQRWVGFSVRDNQGSLRTVDVLERLNRQFSLEGLTDESGRGLFLARALATELIICVVPGFVTEITALFDLQNPEADKTLCLFEYPK